MLSICFIFPTVFITELNGKLVEPTSDTIASEEKGPISFRGDGLNLLLDGDKLKFKVENIDETFILNHAVHVTALKKPTRILKGGGVNVLPSLHFDDMTVCDAKLTLKTQEGEEHRTYKTGSHTAPSRQWDGFGDYGLMNMMEDRKKTAAELYADAVATAAIVKYPGSVKLQFPMDLSLQGFKETIKIKETGETFIVCHTVNLKVLKESGDKIKNKELKNPKIDVLIQSGDINFKLLDGSYQGMRLRHEVSITLTDDNQMYITPMTKFRMIEE
ncbi:hypothetical protein HCN44_006880 [Aphidius gifuensis]|uniref:Uncharacterized protein n=1 Tax=Aphidius gifuensis TaxID=684658 RepID=A0A834XY91_APHGI|nr:hypothetical protein HCN44_006880 [Aphidius gifuensis]